jgi:hypothetical protein
MVDYSALIFIFEEEFSPASPEWEYKIVHDYQKPLGRRDETFRWG